jgi:hypothetical protein
VASVLALVCGSTGCSATRRLPDGPSEAEVRAAVKERIDRQWMLSGLDGVRPRPLIAVQKVQQSGQWNPELGVCLREAGIRDWGYSPHEGLRIQNAVANPEQQMMMYICFARYPAVDVLSTDQIDYIYDYFVRWLVPCLELHGYQVGDAPTRAIFAARAVAGDGLWNPYHALTRFPGSPEEQSRLLEECQPTVEGVPGWSG